MSDPSSYDPHGIGASSDDGPTDWQQAGEWTPPPAPPDWAPTPPPVRRRPWFVLPLVILVALAVVAGGAYAVWHFTRPAQDQGVVTGLREKPALTWSYVLDPDVTGRPEPVGTDRALIVPQIEGTSGVVPVTMIRLTDGKELWRSEINPSGQVFVTGGEIPGTDFVYLMEHHLSEDSPSVLTVRAADDGSVVATRELTEVVGVSAAEGSLFMIGLERLARLDPAALDQPLWEVDHQFAEWGDGGLHVSVRNGHALLTFGAADTPFSSRGTVVSAHDLQDGSTPPWQPEQGRTVLVTDEARVLMTHSEDATQLTGVGEDGTEEWTVDAKPGISYANGQALLIGEYSADSAELSWQRHDPASGAAMWPTALGTSSTASLAALGDVLVATDSAVPAVTVVAGDTGQPGVTFRGEGHQSAYFAGTERVYVASALVPSETVEADGSVSSPNGIRLAAVDTDAAQPAWTLDIAGPTKVLQCGAHLIAVNTQSGTINGIG